MRKVRPGLCVGNTGLDSSYGSEGLPCIRITVKNLAIVDQRDMPLVHIVLVGSEKDRTVLIP